MTETAFQRTTLIKQRFIKRDNAREKTTETAFKRATLVRLFAAEPEAPALGPHIMRKRNLRLNPKLQPWAHVSLQWKMEMMRRGSLQQPPPMLRRSDREVDQMLTAMAVRALAPAKPTRLWPSHAH